MRFAEVIKRRIHKRGHGVDLVGDVNAAVAANVGERGGTTHVSSSQRITQRSGPKWRPAGSENDQQQGR
jgi:hypothetical protein